MKNAENLFENLWKSLTTRQQEILSGRFGLLKYKKPQTLAALGKKYGITRERVRQIETVALKSLKDKILSTPEFVAAFESAKKFLKGMGGVAPKDALLKHLSDTIAGLTENHLALLLDSTNAFYFRGDDEEFYAFYYSDPAALKAAESFIGQWIETLRKNRDEVLAGGYEELFKKFIKMRTINQSVAENYISLSRLVHQNPYGDRGLSEWPEIRPTTIRDRIYLVLKKAGEPLHFQTIAQTINKVGFGSRTALAPTVHNELIKDSRFVLVGRGIYGLSESGFQPGTAREVIHRILKNNGPLKPREVILAVQKERFLKPNTVLVNLQNKQYFQRNEDGTYGVREA